MKLNKIYQFDTPIRMVHGRYGPCFYNQFDSYIGRCIENYGEYCQHEIDLFKQILKETDVVWEIGANTGSQSVALAKTVHKGTYIGFEPQIELFKIFCSNLIINGCVNALPYNLALGNINGLIDLPNINYKAPKNFGAISLIESEKTNDNCLQVEIKKIDNLTWLAKPDFIKMDVEGMESNVLLGGTHLIESQLPSMYIENDRIEKSEELIQILWDFGYDLYWHITPYFNENNFFMNSNNLFGSAASFNMLCFHKSKNVSVNGFNKIIDKSFHPLKP